jgi:UDP-GlcNAc:undecaprenyl-phosphate/decaprenyl-phosphate GlcNAc-1-phosphate transferase
MLNYILITFLLVAAILAYFRIADRFNIIDKPNKRSSHSYITIRGGGIIFPLAAMLWFAFYGFQQPWAIAALLLIAAISFIDDLRPLSGKIRMLVHIVSVSLLFYGLGVFGLSWYVIAGAYLLAAFWINAFNFMDGINAITPFYAFVALATFLYLNFNYQFFSFELMVLLIISTVIFSFFNARKRAKTFAGDVGSISLAFLLAWMLLELILTTGCIGYILLFVVYGLDTVFTIIIRLIRGENIFKAHRSHLYQLLSNELNRPHVQVAALYAVAQLLINLLVVYLVINDLMSLPVLLILIVLLAKIYITVRFITRTYIRKISG